MKEIIEKITALINVTEKRIKECTKVVEQTQELAISLYTNEAIDAFAQAVEQHTCLVEIYTLLAEITKIIANK